MTAPVVVDRVAKRFALEHHRPTSLRERFIRTRWRGGTVDELWALRDVSFRVHAGEVFGVLGSNGSGKSTLLRLIAGVMEPTNGSIQTQGRVGALLDLAAGFHPELTGLENIDLNGALLGMGPSEVAQKRDAIVAFSGVREFIDSPLKYYSSGMLMRLGFSIAIHLDPEVLLVDEVLAVGDEEFQRRCLEKIDALRAAGKCVVLVTHDMAQVRQTCHSAIWLEHGAIAASGKAESVVNAYMASADKSQTVSNPDEHGTRWGSREIEIQGVAIHGEGGEEDLPLTGKPFTVRIEYRAHVPIDHPVFGIGIHRLDGVHVSGPNTATGGLNIGRVAGPGSVEFHVDRLPLLPGVYFLSAAVYDQSIRHPYDHHDTMYRFRVGKEGTREKEGVVNLAGSWFHRHEESFSPSDREQEVSHG
ncbi:ABC transporter ATP-binding protein [Candidatus Fermentibacteria bacterium]|nr:ABC transporter ATP-binding protein [Candidatus Fermentibacteria bacterium]